jgi:prepilin-type N-terminal cleavage/methylation domain-containing protein
LGKGRSASGFSLIELLIATGLLLIVSSIVTSALMQMTNSQKTIWNRTEMHSGIRGATELLQQEVGQAGRLNVPATITLSAPGVTTPAMSCDPATPTTVNSTAGLFASAGPPAAYELLTTMDGNQQETIKVASFTSTSITACFLNTHGSGAVLQPLGAFATGIIPPTGVVSGSTGSVLKLFGDINGDGNMVYIEYTCDPLPGGSGNLYRNMVAFDVAPPKPAISQAQILLTNVYTNPGNPPAPCFTYQTQQLTVQGTPFTFVTDVAITLTVQTEQVDPITRQYQTETKALLNVSPRNVFDAWELASIGYTDRIQSTPATVTALLP